MPVTINGSSGITANDGSVFTNASGNVGIGTASPNSFGKLAVAGNISTASDNTFIGLNDGTQNTLSLVKKAGGFPCIASASGTPIIFSQSSASSIASASAETYTERMRINAAGDLIINSTSGNGACKLNVNGNIFQAPSYSGNFTGGWQNVVNIDSTFGGSSGRIRVHANENGNNNVSYGEWFYVTSAAGPQISAQGQVTVGNAFGTAQLRMSGPTLQIQNALAGAIGSWKVTFEVYAG